MSETGSDLLLERLLALHPRLIDLSLDRMWRLLAALDHPQDKCPPIIHIAGTNGKGSTAAMLRAILEADSKAVHAYHSPHLVRFHERILLAGEEISETTLADVLVRVEAANQGRPITFFEVTTAAAFLAFSEMPADYLILEVGLGGRLDATNVITPALSAITPVSLDHQDFLGDTLLSIAEEKAGIMKLGVSCIIAPQAPDAQAHLETLAARRGTPLICAGQDYHMREEDGRLVYHYESGLLD
ncbi:MAG: bifunctional folylpolyglutamate synthase/dihydrofolate synthase, partial [Alphaproteobacteria bacterium]|nr:bifunctional folylpolyglutamate synthase/dihydrofolate synthase [Alphaproteobacteria bacterium]